MKNLAPGIYELLIDEFLRDAISRSPELRTVFGKIDPEEQPSLYASFVAKVLEQALREDSDPERRLALCNRILDQVASEPGLGHLASHRLVRVQKPILLEITPPHYGTSGIPRPQSPLSESSLFTGSPQEPQLAHELLHEMKSADSVDILVSFIKWSGLRLLMPAFEDLWQRDVPVRVITTSYMGASDAPAVEWPAAMPNIKVRVSYDTERTRLHAKAYHFRRNLRRTGTAGNLSPLTPCSRAASGRPFPVSETERQGCSRFFDLTPHPFQERILDAVERVRYESERPIKIVWRLQHPMPVEMFEDNRRGG